jgi:hypothetical protein
MTSEYTLIYNDEAGNTIFRKVNRANLIAVAQEASRRCPRMQYSHILGFLENKLKSLTGQ